MDHDFYDLFQHFWWLIFPLFWMIFALAWAGSRHSRANRALDIIKAYADQGKEPPPELVKRLQGDLGGGRDSWRCSPERRLHRAILFTALAVAFGVMTFWNYDDSGHWRHTSGLLIPMAIFAAMAFSNFLSLLAMPHWSPPRDRDGKDS